MNAPQSGLPAAPSPDARPGARRPLIAVLRTAWLYASAGFGYVAVSAVFRPGQVGERLWHSLPWLRKDTFGIVCFAVSALSYLLLGLACRSPVSRETGQAPHDLPSPARPPAARSLRSAATPVLATAALYGFAGWAYIACNAIRHPGTLARPLTHLAWWPHEDEFGLGCFVTSLFAYFLLQLSKAGNAHR